MNLALQALAIFALALPGIILKKSYRNGFFWDRPRQQSQIAEEVAYSLLLACALHAVYAPIVNLYRPIDLNAVVMLLLGEYGRDNEHLAATIVALTVHPGRIFGYFAGLYAVSGGWGLAAHAVVRHFKLDHKSRFFRFDHQWHYLLHGEIANFPESNVKVPAFDFISVACVADTNAGSFLYVGVLDAFYFSKTGELDLLVLTGAMRRPIDPELAKLVGCETRQLLHRRRIPLPQIQRRKERQHPLRRTTARNCSRGLTASVRDCGRRDRDLACCG